MVRFLANKLQIKKAEEKLNETKTKVSGTQSQASDLGIKGELEALPSIKGFPKKGDLSAFIKFGLAQLKAEIAASKKKNQLPKQLASKRENDTKVKEKLLDDNGPARIPVTISTSMSFRFRDKQANETIIL